IAWHGLPLLARIVEIMRGAGIERDRDIAAGVDRALGDVLADLGRDLLVGAAEKEGEPRRGRHRVRKQRVAAAARVERQRRAATALGPLPDHHVERGRSAVRPALQEDAASVDIAAAAEVAERALGIERPYRELVDAVAIGIAMGEAAKAMRLAARPKAV